MAIIGIVTIILAVLFAMSLASYSPRDEMILTHYTLIDNSMGFAGVVFSTIFIKWGFGYVAWGLIPLIAVWGIFILFNLNKKLLKRTSWFYLVFLLLLSVLMSIELSPDSGRQFPLFSGMIAYAMSDWIGIAPSIIVLISSMFMLISAYFHFSVSAPFQSLKEGRRLEKTKTTPPKVMKPQKEKRTKNVKREKHAKLVKLPVKNHKNGKENDNILDKLKDPSEQKEKDAIPLEQRVSKSIEEAPIERIAKAQISPEEVQSRNCQLEYTLPSIDLLEKEPKDNSYNEEELQEKAKKLSEMLPKYGVDGRVVRILPGPVITMYEVALGEGVRVSKINNLEKDIARVMAAKHIRILAPIPGKTVVGVEIPNKHPELIYFKSIVESDAFKRSKSVLSLAIGKTADGTPFSFDLDKMPHLLIGGTTGSGKSVCINTIIMSILYQATPEQVKFILVDPKKIELSIYKRLEPYHLITSEDIDEYVVTNVQNAIFMLRSALIEMESRYTKLEKASVRNIAEYNAKMKKNKQAIMPYIVVVIDELAELMSNKATKADIELPIQRLAQMARAVGIHLVVATQRPSVDVITGLIRSNIPARISFAVPTKTDSRTILDTGGGETLLGRGDMLFLPPGKPTPIRAHNAYISLEEINVVLDHIQKQPKREDDLILPTSIEPEPQEEMDENKSNRRNEKDALFDEAMKLVILHQQGSASLLQRRLRVGYSRAGRLIDELEEAGIVGPSRGSKAREVYADMDYYEHLKSMEDGSFDDD